MAGKGARRRIPKEAKRNLKLWAEGPRETVLMPHVEPYADASLRGWKAERDYWQSVCNEFHARISWRLKDHEEPPLPLPDYDPNSMRIEEVLTMEERTQRLARIKELNDRIRRWLKTRVKSLRSLWTSTRCDPRKNPYAVLMAKLSGVVSPPKARQAYQQFMAERYATDISPVAQSRWQVEIQAGRQPSDSHPTAAFRAKVSRDLFQKLPPQEQVKYTKTARADAAAAKDKYEKEMKSPPSKNPAAIQRCIDRIPAFLGPVIEGVQERTGLKFFVMYGGPCPVNEGEVTSWHMNFGFNNANQPVPFSQYRRDEFKHGVYALWTEWLNTCYTPEDIKQSALRPELNDEEPYSLAPDSSSSSESEGEEEDAEDGGLSDTENRPPNKRRRLEKSNARLAGALPLQPIPLGSLTPFPVTSPTAAVATSAGNDSLLTQLLRKEAAKRPGKSIVFLSPSPTTPSSLTGQANEASTPPISVPTPPESPTTFDHSTIPPSREQPLSSPLPVEVVSGAIPATQVVPTALNHDAVGSVPPPQGHTHTLATRTPPVSPIATTAIGADNFPAASNILHSPPNDLSGHGGTLSIPTKTTADRDAPPLKRQKVSPSSSWVRKRVARPMPKPTPPIRKSAPSPPVGVSAALAEAASQPTNLPSSSVSPIRLGGVVMPTPLSAGNVTSPSASPIPNPTTSTTSFPSCPTTAASWFNEAFKSVTCQDLGQDFAEVVRLFMAIETAHDYANPSRGLPTKRRPAEVTKWIGSGRWRGKPPSITKPGKFSESWWAWWLSLQPSWRVYDPIGRPIAATIHGDTWDSLLFPGQNGILSIVACLSWWGCAIMHTPPNDGAGSVDDWQAAIQDVRWMFEGLLAHLG